MQEYWFYGRFWCDEKMPKRFPEFLCHFTFPPAVCDLVHPHACQHLVCCSFYSYFSVHFTTTSGIHELIRAFGVISWTDFWMDFKNTVEFPGSLASSTAVSHRAWQNAFPPTQTYCQVFDERKFTTLRCPNLSIFPLIFGVKSERVFFCHKH